MMIWEYFHFVIIDFSHGSINILNTLDIPDSWDIGLYESTLFGSLSQCNVY